MSLSYQKKLNLIKDITALGINSKKYSAKNPNFTTREKWLISRYYNLADKNGFFDFREKDGGFRVKYVKTKTRNKKAGKRFTGYFVQGASPSDKIRNGKIIKGNFEKLFIPLDFSDIDEQKAEFVAEYPGEEMSEFDLIPYVEYELNNALEGYDLKEGDYFTIVLQNGWELGQYNRKTTSEKDRRDGQKIAQDLSGEKKIKNLARKIAEQLHQGTNKYQMGTLALVAGIYLWKFKNQRKPNKAELEAIRGRKKK